MTDGPVSGEASGYLCSVSGLEAVVGERPATGGLKSINHLDAHCDAFLAASSFAIAGTVGADGQIHMSAAGGPTGHAGTHGPGVLRFSGAHGFTPDDPADAPVGVLAMAAGYRETLRVNGRLRLDDGASIVVEEAFLHCAKAIIRSRLWSPADDSVEPDRRRSTSLDDATRAFLARSPFVALGTVDDRDHADVSPKGDPAGFITVLDDGTLAIPDRPGNRRTDTLHNLIDHDQLGLLALVPGDARVLEIRGRAQITDAPDIRERMVVNGKAPKAAIVLHVEHVDLRDEPALIASGLWDPSRQIDPRSLPKSSQIWVDHIRLNDDPGEEAEALRQLIDEKALAAGLEVDYEVNLY